MLRLCAAFPMLPACITVIRTCRSCSFIRRPMRSLNCIAHSCVLVMISSDNSIMRFWQHRLFSLTEAREIAGYQDRAFRKYATREDAMKIPHRRQFLHLAAGTAVLSAVSRIARAQAYPARPVTVIVPFAPG